MNSTFVADGEQIAVGSANGYPAVWRRGSTGTWALVTPLSLVSASPGLASLSSVTHGSAGSITAGTPGPVILTSADGTTWQAAGGNIMSDLAKGSRRRHGLRAGRKPDRRQAGGIGRRMRGR